MNLESIKPTLQRVLRNIGLPGQYYDSETNLHYNYFRDYDPTTGRYLQSDPIGLRGGRNSYVYSATNPIRYFDAKGLFYVKPVKGPQPTNVPNVKEMAGIKCNDKGGFEPEIYSDDKCLWKCLREHENKHVEQIKNANPTICSNPDFVGYRVAPNPDGKEGPVSELEGYSVELECLQKENCPECNNSIKERIKFINREIPVLKSKIPHPMI